MFTLILVNFFIGIFVSLAVFLVGIYISREEQFSAPFFVIVIGLLCAILSIFFAYTSTWIILGLYTLISMVGLYKERNT